MPGASCGRRDEVVRLESDLPYPETIARPSSLPDETSRCEREGLPYRFDKKALKPDYSKYPPGARAPLQGQVSGEAPACHLPFQASGRPNSPFSPCGRRGQGEISQG